MFTVKSISTIALVIWLFLIGFGLSKTAAQQDARLTEYEKSQATDPIAQLQQKIDSGQVKLDYEPQFGWLQSVLQQLGIAKESQILTFGKTSFQAPLISPRKPRAIYFNDKVSVGFVRTGDVLEFASLDPNQGVIFYTLDQAPSREPSFQRRDSCLQCHMNPATLNVPGLFIRSITAERTGMPVNRGPSFVTDHRSPLKERWGGWYVTGTHGAQRHMGNTYVQSGDDANFLYDKDTQNQTSLRGRFTLEEYYSPYSDIVALMVMEHQTRMTNLLTLAKWEARKDASKLRELLNKPLINRKQTNEEEEDIQSICEQLIAYMLFADEAQLIESVKGVSGYAEWFAKQGPFDGQGRSLRQFDLNKRMFQYRCSYLIYTDSFDNLPIEVRAYVYQRLWDILNGKDSSHRFDYLPQKEREAIRDILIATKKGLPGYWKKTEH
ncbi:MAG TPA: hypothetical protein VEF04_13440 [Blastocatellia bacterium]|nr:hypothetical protein [Blastocatellia bacterium]